MTANVPPIFFDEARDLLEVFQRGLLDRARDAEAINALVSDERLRQRLTLIRPPFPGGERLAISASIGLAHAGPDDQGIYALLARGDQALYAAKAQGRNRVVDWSAVAS